MKLQSFEIKAQNTLAALATSENKKQVLATIFKDAYFESLEEVAQVLLKAAAETMKPEQEDPVRYRVLHSVVNTVRAMKADLK